MGILNFAEIPAASKGKPPKDWKTNPRHFADTSDLDAFEKFAEEFFEKILRYSIVSRVARGPDNHKDLIVKNGQERYLVSCKHYANSDRSVQADDEYDPAKSLKVHACKKFIAFYSTAPHTSLVRDFEGLKSNPDCSFDYEILKNTDIESILLDQDNAAGWLFAARYFPKSFANLFRRFVVPISHYSESDLRRRPSGGWRLDRPYGGECGPTDTDKQEMVRSANDALTSAVHIRFFSEALKEFIDRFPRYFGYPEFARPQHLELCEIFPLWDEPFNRQDEARVVCSVWSFWSATRATEKYLKFAKPTIRVNDSYDELTTITYSSQLSLGGNALRMDGESRDVFSRLVAFCPAGIKQLSDPSRIYRQSVYQNRLPQLEASIAKLEVTLSDDHRADFLRHGGWDSTEKALEGLIANLGIQAVSDQCSTFGGGLSDITYLSFVDPKGKLVEWSFAPNADCQWLSARLGC